MDKRIVVASYDATNLFFEFYDAANFSQLTYSFKLTKGYSGSPEATSKLATSGEFVTNLYVCQVLYFYGGLSETTFNFVKITNISPPPAPPAYLYRSNISTYKLPSALKCLHVEIDSITKDPLFIMVDSLN